MNGLLGAEWIKMRRRLMPRIIVLILLIILALIFWGNGARSSDLSNVLIPRSWIFALFLTMAFAPFLWPVLGGSWAGNEYGWGTVRMVLSRRPDRIQFALAGLVILIAAVILGLIAVLLLSTVAGAVIALLTGHSVIVTSGLQSGYGLIVVKVFLGAAYILTFYVVLAYAAGTIFRSGAVGIGAGIGITVAQLILTGILFALGGTWKTVAEHFPYQYTNALATRLADEGMPENFRATSSNAPGIGECLIGLTISIAILIAATLVVIRQRDVTD